MSAIGAIFSVREKAIKEQDLIALNASMKRHGKNGTNHWFSNQCGLVQQTHHLTSNTELELFPYFNKTREIGIVTHARLFNRKDLQRVLRMSCSDPKLILAAYLKWDLDFTSYLVGEFSLVLWDKQLHRLVVAVDHFNARPLYYFFNQEFLVVTSVLSAIHSLKWVPRTPNLNVIARHDFKRFLVEPGETCFKDIHFLPAAHILIADTSGVKIKNYWRPSLGEPLLFKSENDFQLAFEEHFSNAVQATLDTNNPVCLQLSGGLDSSAIALMASKLFDAENKQLVCLSNYLPQNNDGNNLKDEREYIDLICGSNLIKEKIVDQWRGPFDYLDLCKTQLYTSPQHYQHQAINAAARKYQASIILHGTLAELTTSYQGYEYLSELFHRLRWMRCLRELSSHRQIYKTSYTRLASLVIHPKIRQFFLQKKPSYVRQKLLTASLINKTFILEQMTFDELACIEDQFIRPMFLYSVDARKNALTQLEYHLRHSSTIFSQMDDELDSALYFSNPYFDKRLVEFCLNTPNTYRFKYGYPRSIIRVGMQKHFPKPIGQRITKSPFLPDYHLRYNQQMAKAKAVLEDIRLQPLVQHVIDVPRLLSYLDEPSSSTRNTENNFLNYYVVPQAVYLAVFLSSFNCTI